MGLSTKEASAGGGGGLKVTDGVYANLKTIEKVKDLSGKKIGFANDKVFDLALEVQYEGDKYPQTYMGNLRTDASGEVTDWGGAFIVALIFTNAGVEAELNAKNRFSPDDLKKLIGKQVYTVSYAAGTYKKDDGTKGNAYNDWNQTFPVYEDEKEVQSMILEAWQKSRSKGYPKKFEIPEGSNLSTGSKRGSGGSKAGKAGVTESVDLTDADDFDDDLPF